MARQYCLENNCVGVYALCVEASTDCVEWWATWIYQSHLVFIKSGVGRVRCLATICHAWHVHPHTTNNVAKEHFFRSDAIFITVMRRVSFTQHIVAYRRFALKKWKPNKTNNAGRKSCLQANLVYITMLTNRTHTRKPKNTKANKNNNDG